MLNANQQTDTLIYSGPFGGVVPVQMVQANAAPAANNGAAAGNGTATAGNATAPANGNNNANANGNNANANGNNANANGNNANNNGNNANNANANGNNANTANNDKRQIAAAADVDCDDEIDSAFEAAAGRQATGRATVARRASEVAADSWAKMKLKRSRVGGWTL